MDGAAKGSAQSIFDVVGAEMTWMQVKWSLNSDQNFVVSSISLRKKHIIMKFGLSSID
jgi:hypothetical protein